MNKLDGYSIYQNPYYENMVNGKKNKDVTKSEQKDKATKTDATKQTEQKSKVQLSDKAKELLEELKKKYTNMDFMVADYETDEEAQSILSRGTKQYSVLIDPDTLEEMAADENVKEEYVGIIDGATSKIQEIKDQLGEEGDEVTHIGFTVGNDGTVNYFAELEKMSAQQKERIEAAKEEKKAQQKEKEEKAEKKEKEEKLEETKEKTDKISGYGAEKRTTVKASSIEELIEKIKNVDWDQVQSVKANSSGIKFDLMI